MRSQAGLNMVTVPWESMKTMPSMAVSTIARKRDSVMTGRATTAATNQIFVPRFQSLRGAYP
jgi:hypothetical protein